MAVTAGVYRHYKGNFYRVLDIADYMHRIARGPHMPQNGAKP